LQAGYFHWLIEVVKRYKKKESVILKFIYGFAINYSELFAAFCGKIITQYNFDESDLPYQDRINLPESDAEGFFVHILRQDYRQIVSISGSIYFLKILTTGVFLNLYLS
jgi:hypothetical protein